MSVLFESILLFSLAVLIIIMGGLVYYFKKRIVEVEQNNATCLEVVQDVYVQHTKLRNEVNGLMSTIHYQFHHSQQTHQYQPPPKTNDELIKIVLSEDENESEDEGLNGIDESEDDQSEDDQSEDDQSEDDQSEDDQSEDDQSEDDQSEDNGDINMKNENNNMKNEDKIKVVNVDLSFPEEFEINIDEDLDGEDGEEESELKSLEQPDHQVVVNKVDTTIHMSKTELKKLSPTVLKNLLIEKGINVEQVSKMKKNELIDKLAVM
jgi:hypothetical protein